MSGLEVFGSLDAYLSAKRGRAAELARRMKVTAGMLTAWRNGSKAIPPLRCVQIEKLTDGQVPRWVLHPDWESLWPELARRRRAQKPAGGSPAAGGAA